MHRDILHIYIPEFPIALARVSDPSLRSRPVAVASGHSERTPIQFLSAEGRSEGLFEGMPLFRARRLCPSLIIIPPDPRKVLGGSRSLARLTQEYSPVWEPSAAGRIYLDLTGSTRLFGAGRDAALKLERDIARRLDLAGSVGVAGNKLVSRIASGCLHKPGVCDVLRGSESQFIAPLPVSVIPGIGETRQKVLLADLNLTLVGQIASLSLPQLSLPFGSFAPLLYHRARGIDPSPVLPPRRSSEISGESVLNEGVNDDPILFAELYRLAEECGLKLRKTGKAASSLTLTITHSDGLSRRRTASLKDPADKDISIFEHVERLFQEITERRVNIKWMNLVCKDLTESSGQMEMFTGLEEADTLGHLQTTLDNVRERYGRSAVQWGRTAESVQCSTFNVQRAGRRTAPSDLRSQVSDLRSSKLKSFGGRQDVK